MPGVNNLGTYGRWAFAEFADVLQIGADFEAVVERHFDDMIARVTASSTSNLHGSAAHV